jgi:hypothetical protein
MYTDTLGTLKALKKQKVNLANRDAQLDERIRKEILRQRRRGWSAEDMAAALGDGYSVRKVEDIAREAQKTYGDRYVSGVLYADKKGDVNPNARTTPKWLPGMEKKEKPAKKAPAAPRAEGEKQPKKKAAAKKAAKKKTVTPPVQATDETHYEDPVFQPDETDNMDEVFSFPVPQDDLLDG